MGGRSEELIVADMPGAPREASGTLTDSDALGSLQLA